MATKNTTSLNFALLRTLSLQNASGEAVPLTSLYERERCAVFFVRHFGCYICRDYVRALTQHDLSTLGWSRAPPPPPPLPQTLLLPSPHLTSLTH
jgi:hypothetical protein